MAFFAKDPKKLELAVSFMKYVYLGKDGMAGWCQAAGYTPVRNSVLKDFPFFSQDKFQSAFGQVIARRRPAAPERLDLSGHQRTHPGRLAERHPPEADPRGSGRQRF